ncbi:MAG: class IV adenylate cyclase [Nitrososphaeria archaeon]
MEREVKLRVKDRGELLERLGELGARFASQKVQVDHYLDIGDSLRSRGESLRVRQEGDDCYITFKGRQLKDELKLREELETPVKNCKTILEIMGRLGFTEKMTVKKVRESYRLNDIIVEVDKVEGLGDFIEIELRGQLQVQDLKVLVDKLGIEWMPIKDGYADMLFKIKKP